MNALKKALAILLSMVMLFSAVGVFAAVVTDETTGMVTYTDDFEGYNITQDTVITKYPDGSTYVSDVFGAGTGTSATIVYNKGKNDSKALKIISSGGDWRTTVTKTITASSSTEVLELSYDLKVTPKNATGDGNVVLGSSGEWGSNPLFEVVYDASGNGYFKDCVNAQNTYEYSSDAWYKVIIRQTNGSGRYGYILDEKGTVVLQTARSSQGWATIAAVFTKGSDGTELTIDNAVLKHYDRTEVAPSLVSSSLGVDIEESATDVQRNKVLTFVFDQEIAADSAITIARQDGKAITEITGITTEKALYNTLVLSYTGLLDRNTEYVISFTNVSNGSLPCADNDISFTTEDLHIWNPISIFTVETNETDAKLTDITFEICDKYGYPTFSGSVMAVVYQDGKMIAVDIKSLTNVNTGELTVNFNLGTVPSGAKIGIILLDLEDGPIPLAGGMLEN